MPRRANNKSYNTGYGGRVEKSYYYNNIGDEVPCSDNNVDVELGGNASEGV